MPLSEAAKVWSDFVNIVQEEEGLTETALVVKPVPEIRDLLAKYHFPPLRAARAEVHWQVLQTTHSSARAKAFAKSIRDAPPSPARPLRTTSPAQRPGAGVYGGGGEVPQSAPRARQGSPATPAASPARGSRIGSPVPGSRAGSPARRLGSMEHVQRPQSLRPLGARSPARSVASSFPVKHDDEFYVHVGPHGRGGRRALVPGVGAAEVEVRSQDPNAIPGPVVMPSPRRQPLPPDSPRGANPNTAGFNCRPDSPSRRAASPQRFMASGSDPNDAGSRVGPQRKLLRQVATESAMRQRTSSSPVVNPRKPDGQQSVRIVPCRAGSSSMTATATPSKGLQPFGIAIVPKREPITQGSDPNPRGNSSLDIKATGTRKSRVEPRAETPPKQARYDPGPAEKGVFPGSEGWEKAAAVAKRKEEASVPRGVASTCNPNDVSLPATRDASGSLVFIGGRARGSAAREERVRHTLYHGAAQSGNVDRDHVPTTCDPNSLVPKELPVKIVRPARPTDSWDGTIYRETGGPPQGADPTVLKQRRHFDGMAEDPHAPTCPVKVPDSPSKRRVPSRECLSPGRMRKVNIQPSFSPRREFSARYVPNERFRASR